MPDPAIEDRPLADLRPDELYGILRLRSDVFVVEQNCVYADLDGRDLEPSARHLWMADDDGPAAYVRLLDDGDARRLGRVVTRADARSAGLAARLIEHTLATSAGPWILHAQAHLAGWYGRFGFTVTGPEFDEDGIPHVAMRRAS